MTETTSYDVRTELESLLERDLVGPWDGAEEELPAGKTPGERYVLGRLVPRRPEGAEPVASLAAADDDGVEDRPELVADEGLDLDADADETPPAAAVRTRAMAASSIGLSFSLPADVDAVLVAADWGRYEQGPSETQQTPTGRPAVVWRRAAVGGSVRVPTSEEVTGGEGVPDAESERVTLRWNVRHRGGRRVVEVFLLNGQEDLQQSPDRHRLYQATVSVTAVDGHRALFLGHNDPDHPEPRREADPELRHLALQHRSQRLYATGRLCAVDAHVRADELRAWRLRTTCFPAAEVSLVEPGTIPGVVLDMARLGSPDLDPDELAQGLRPLSSLYTAWLAEQEGRLATDPEVKSYSDVAEPALERARAVAERLDRAIDLLRADPVALEAFRFANQAMARQRVRSELVRARAARPEASVAELLKELNTPHNHSWRPFQLAFVLLCLPGLTDPGHPDAHRGELTAGEAQLLFFPTGGGKTEAYLGLTAFTMAIRRLQGPVGTGKDRREGHDGVAVLMRYTLRLLTAQQFQRATALVCAAELLRRERLDAGDRRWGAMPMRVGLWVGSGVTPNSYDDAERALVDAAARAGEGQVGGLLQFAACPWCGTPLDLGRDGKADKVERRIRLFCGDPDGRCAFSPRHSRDGLPVLVVDEEIYRLVPSLVIATVDKFAQLPWKSSTAQLFGLVSSRCERHGYRSPEMREWCGHGGHPRRGVYPGVRPEPVGVLLRPPDLIIQDELHLISDALGSMVGLYETIVDRLCSRPDGAAWIRPALVASTATVRRAGAQVRQVFARSLTVFPPPLIDAGETFFSRRVPPSPTTPGRRYRGVLAPGERLTAVEIRVATALLEFGQLLLDQHGAAADPYLTLVDYFTSTRELAGMRRLVEDDVTDRLNRPGALVRRRAPSVAELTSRMASSKITQSLADLERAFDPTQDSTAARRELAELRKRDRGAWEKVARLARPVDVLLATSMLQVGIDIQRLGLMLVTGQPKNMAEYIQASSRVGRSTSAPGLVITLYQWSRPRDLAHYEQFGYEHATFGRRVEGLTTTPYSERALDRGLAGLLVAAARQSSPQALPNLGAQTVPLDAAHVGGLIEYLRRRAETVTESAPAAQAVADRAQVLFDAWLLKRAKLSGGQLGYEADATGAAAGLLQRPDDERWRTWTAPLSLRDVELEVLLQLRASDTSVESAPEWDFSATPRARS